MIGGISKVEIIGIKYLSTNTCLFKKMTGSPCRKELSGFESSLGFYFLFEKMKNENRFEISPATSQERIQKNRK